MQPQFDKIIDNKYAWNYEKELGRGAFASVYLGKNIQTGEDIAVKVYSRMLIQKENLEPQLMKEINLMRSLKNLHIVSIFDCLQTPNNIYLVLEYCNGGDLAKFVKKEGGKLKEDKAIEILYQIAEAFKTLVVANIIHRDLKPDNIFIHNNTIKLADFGFATQIKQQNTLMTSMLGTPIQMAPQIMDGKAYSSKCDIWSLGVIFHEMLQGRLPWDLKTDSLLALRSAVKKGDLVFPPQTQVSEESKSFIIKCLEREENKRLSWNDIFNMPIITKGKNLYSSPSKLYQSQSKIESKILKKKILEPVEIKYPEVNKQNPQIIKSPSVPIHVPQKPVEQPIYNTPQGNEENKDGFVYEGDLPNIVKLVRKQMEEFHIRIDDVWANFELKPEKDALDKDSFMRLLNFIDEKWSKDKFLVAVLFDSIPKKDPMKIAINEFNKAIEDDEKVEKIKLKELSVKLSPEKISKLRKKLCWDIKNRNIESVFKNQIIAKDLSVITMDGFDKMIKESPGMKEENINEIEKEKLFQEFDITKSWQIDFQTFKKIVESEKKE